MNNRNAATAVGAGVGVAFGPDLLQWLGNIILHFFPSTFRNFPEMPESVLLTAGAALAAVITRWWWGCEPRNPQYSINTEEPYDGDR